MAADHWSIEYHLTPAGVVTGTSKTFGKVDGKEVPRPDNAVETWEEDSYQSSPFSKDVYTYQLLWHDDKVPEQDRIEIRRRFPPPFTKPPKDFI